MIGAMTGGGLGASSSIFFAPQFEGVNGSSNGPNSFVGGGGATQSSATISGPGQLLSDLQQLQAQDPATFAQLVSQIAGQLQTAAQQAQGPQNAFLSQLGANFQSVASNGSLSVLQPQQPYALQAYSQSMQNSSQELPSSSQAGTSQSTTGSDLQTLFATIANVMSQALAASQAATASPQSAGATPTTTAGSSGPEQSFWADFQQLAQALQSGNLSGAQQAYNSLAQTPQFQNLESQANTGSGTGGSFLQALTQIGSDLQSGDLSDAQQALASLQQQMQAQASADTGQSQGAGRHHHHHHAGAADGSQSASSPGTSATGSGAASGNPLLNILTKIQNTLTTIVNDLSGGSTSTSTTGSATAST